MRIPFNKEYHSSREQAYLAEAAGALTRRIYTKRCEIWLREKFPDSQVIMTSSATMALELGLLSMELRPGDEIILPSFAYPSIANAVLVSGGKPVFTEIDPVTLSIAPNDLPLHITSRTRAVIAVHYGGSSHHLNEIAALCNRHEIAYFEDASHSFGAGLNGRPLGSIGNFGVFSFHHTKNITAGNGGVLLVNGKDNEHYYDRCRIISENGTNRLDFLDGLADNYKWQRIGLNVSPSELAMAMLLAQLEQSEQILSSRRAPFEAYHAYIETLAKPHPVILSSSPIRPDGESNFHTFYIRTRTGAQRNELKDRLLSKGVSAVSHFEPLHSAPMGLSLGYSTEDFPETVQTAATLLRLPMYNYMTQPEYEYVVTSTAECLEEMTR